MPGQITNRDFPRMKYFPNIRLVLIVLFFLVLANFASTTRGQESAQDKKADEGDVSDFEGIFKIKNWDKDIKLPEVKDDAKNVFREPYHPDELSGVLESTTGLAAKIAIADKFKWQPLWRYEGAGVILLPAITISDDKSLLAVIERTGEIKGPNASRIVIFRVSDWKIIRIHEIKDRKIENAIFLPESLELLLVSSRQSEMRQSNEIMIMDADSGGRINSKKIKNKIKNIFPLDSEIIVVVEADRDKGVSDIFSLEKESLQIKRKFKTANDDGIIALDSSNGERFFFAGNNVVELFSISQDDPVAKFASPENSIPLVFLSLSGDSLFSLIYPNSGAYLFRGGKSRKLMDMADSVLLYEKTGEYLMINSVQNDTAVLFKAPDFEKVDSFSPSSLKPKTNGDIIFSTSLLKQNYLFVDKHGNIFICEKKGKKWKKELIVDAMK